MSLKKDGIMIILSSPSGAGKTTLTNFLSKKFKFHTSISHTTRKPRPKEINSKHYFFVNKKEFNQLILNNKFLEYAKVFKNFYGTSKDNVFKKLRSGRDVLFDIDWQGTKKIKNKKLNFKILTIFVLPPSRSVLFKRLSNRDMRDKLIVEERMKQFNKDILHWKDYDYVVINDKLDKCIKEIKKIIFMKKKKLKYSQKKKKIKQHVKYLLN